ncbi:hypothetical protein [Nakamurella endophytica]|uniref:hypothetical protein n=1 Tax=Nakamurella endophytica TaxID=1748367 RepID=UPI001E29294D|nr:hypothetical protein [Nakamurella endophytica]
MPPPELVLPELIPELIEDELAPELIEDEPVSEDIAVELSEPPVADDDATEDADELSEDELDEELEEPDELVLLPQAATTRAPATSRPTPAEVLSRI